MQADTIVSEPMSSQLYNRYVYVSNNPVRYNDPTGHFRQCTSDGYCYDDGFSISNPSFTSNDSDERREQLLAYNNNLYEWAQKGWITDLDAFAELADYAASMIPGDFAGNRIKAFIYDLASILTEIEGRTYYDKARPLGESGFAWIFQDPSTGGAQPHHFWAYVTYNLKYGADIARIGNFAHETFFGSTRPLRGRSYQDYALGRAGITLSANLISGKVGSEEVGDYIRNNLAPGGTAANHWDNATKDKMNYAAYLAIASVLVPIPPGEQGGR